MRLYKVVVVYEDYYAWKKQQGKSSSEGAWNLLSLEGQSEYKKEATLYAVVPSDFGGNPLKEAADLAIREFICGDDLLDKFWPVVKKVEELGPVAVEGE